MKLAKKKRNHNSRNQPSTNSETSKMLLITKNNFLNTTFKSKKIACHLMCGMARIARGYWFRSPPSVDSTVIRSINFNEDTERAPDSAGVAAQRSACKSERHLAIGYEGLIPRFPLEKAFTVDWLQLSRPANSCWVRPVANNSSVIFRMSMRIIITYVFRDFNTFVMRIFITIVI